MKIKEIHVGITYPYQLAPYMYGRIELAELIAIEPHDIEEEVKQKTIEKLKAQCKEEALKMVIGDEEQKEPEPPQNAPSSTTRRKRRF